LRSVLLVDDEIYVLERIKRIIQWEKYGYEVVGAVTSGEKAISFLKNTKVDVVISDINMPMMSGLELYDWLNRQADLRIYKVILTGYADFEYAKQAICYGVKDYLLKPINTEELILCLSKAKKAIDMAKDQYSHIKATKTLTDNKNKNCLLNFLKWNITLDELKNNTKLPEMLREDIKAVCCIITINAEEKWRDKKEQCKQNVINLFNSVLKEKTANFYMVEDQMDIIILFNTDMFKDSLFKILKPCIDKINTKFIDVHVICYIGKTTTGLEDLPKAYGTALYVMRNHVFSSSKSVVTFADLVFTNNTKDMIQKHLLRIKVFFNCKDSSSLCQEIMKIFEPKEESSPSYNNILWIVDALNDMIQEIAFENGIDKAEIIENYYPAEKLLTNKINTQDLVRYFNDRFQALSETLKGFNKNKSYSDIIKKVILYIENNYMVEDLNVKKRERIGNCVKLHCQIK